MPGSILSQWVIPIVVVVALFSWLGAVLYADKHPRYKHHSTLPRYEVTGGAFEANDGGRQLMPIPGERPVADRPGSAGAAAAAASGRVPAQRGASSTASMAAPSAEAGQTGAGEPVIPGQRRAEPGQRTVEERHLAEGSKLR